MKKGQIVKFPKNMSEDDIVELVASYKFKVFFYEPGSTEFNKYGKNTCRLL
jgi:hypothetical protein